MHQAVRTLLIGLCLGLLPHAAMAHEVELTIYDDGRSCPGNCDAHVVMQSPLNGTVHAFDPSSSAQAPQACRRGQACRICFIDNDPASCMTVTYRGSGPPGDKFDFTPAFYAEHCGADDIPETLAKQCRRMAAAVRREGYDTRLNCFATPEHETCAPIMEAAQQAFDADLPNWKACKAEGQEDYNARQGSDQTRRIYDCAYSKLSLGGPNSNGVRWKKLLPAACRPGTFVGRDGLDCCNGDASIAAGLHPECSGFHPQQ